MIFLFGDSHANFNFKGLKYPNRNLHTNSVTMHRVGRDGKSLLIFRKKVSKTGILSFINSEKLIVEPM